MHKLLSQQQLKTRCIPEFLIPVYLGRAVASQLEGGFSKHTIINVSDTLLGSYIISNPLPKPILQVKKEPLPGRLTSTQPHLDGGLDQGDLRASHPAVHSPPHVTLPSLGWNSIFRTGES